jgi:hypothetical protein
VSAAPPRARCDYCGADVPGDARYCLECGEGLRPYELLDEKGTPVRTAADGTTIVERRGPRGIIVWPILLLVVVLGALAAYALTSGDDEQPTAATNAVSSPVITSTVTTSVTATGPATDTVGSATETAATDTAATDTTATDTTPTDTTTTEPTTTTAARPDDWSGTGYTVIVQSFPKATKTQQDAIAFQQGLTGVTGSGVLDSDNYADLKPGWWVVFVGKYTTADEANAAAAKLRSQGQTGAYGRKVA